MIFIFAAHYGEVENIIKRKKMGKRKLSFPHFLPLYDIFHFAVMRRKDKNHSVLLQILIGL